ncbi:MAG: hypothetical protein EG823_06650 [Actinobacteria bacterium]|nr:hypothetical protein [Actinomycetota bacterium]
MYTQLGYGMMGGQRLIHGMGYGLGGLWIVALVGFLVVAATIIALAIWAAGRKSSGKAAGTPQAPVAPPAEDSALAIARGRLARGEISPEEYTAIAAALNGQPLPAQPAEPKLPLEG